MTESNMLASNLFRPTFELADQTLEDYFTFRFPRLGFFPKRRKKKNTVAASPLLTTVALKSGPGYLVFCWRSSTLVKPVFIIQKSWKNKSVPT